MKETIKAYAGVVSMTVLASVFLMVAVYGGLSLYRRDALVMQHEVVLTQIINVIKSAQQAAATPPAPAGQ